MINQLFVVGLGNPGEKYRFTRHNVGHLFIEYLFNEYKVKRTQGKGPFYFATKNICGRKIFLVKTNTFMNISKDAVLYLLGQFNGLPQELIIVCDDFNLPFGVLRLRLRGSDGGQKGLKSIINALDTNKIARLRIGIGVEEDFDPVEFVLSEFTEEEKEKLPIIFKNAKMSIETFVCQGAQKAMSLYNKNVLE